MNNLSTVTTLMPGNTAVPVSGSATTGPSSESRQPQTNQYPYGLLTAEAYHAIRAAVAEELRNNPPSRVVSFAGGGGGEGGLSAAISHGRGTADPQGTVLVSLYEYYPNHDEN